MKSTYCTAISKSDDISPEKKTFLLQSISSSLSGETIKKKTPFLLGILSLQLVTPVTPAAAVQLANWGPELGPASVLTFTWKLVLCGHFLTAC